MVKICVKCKDSLDVSLFYKDKSNRDGYEFRCKTCKVEIRDKSYNKTKDRIYARASKWYQENKVQHQANHSRRLRENPNAYLAKLFRDRIYKCIRHEGKKTKPTLDILGCSWDEFKSWVESHFQEGMTWDNKGKGEGKWNIDHGIPISWANGIDEIQKLNHHTNLKPEWSSNNESKRDFYGEIWDGEYWVVIEKEYYDQNSLSLFS